MNFWLALSLLVGLVLVLTFLPAILAVSCPSRTYGNGSSVIKYFSSPLCVACWYQTPELETFAKKYSDKFRVEEYDSDFCSEHAAPNRIMGTPSFIFNDTVSYGFKTSEQLAELV